MTLPIKAASYGISLEQLPVEEMQSRHNRCRKLLAEKAPDLGGIMVFSRVNIYYLTGTLGNGVLWLPVQGEPVLLCRKGEERAKLESPLKNIGSFRSFGDLGRGFAEFGSPLPQTIGAEMTGLSWELSNLLVSRMKETVFLPADAILTRLRSVKSEWELTKMRLCGQRHHRCLYSELPQVIRPGMTEREIAIKAWEVFFAAGHQGLMRMSAFGEEIFLGHVAVGDSANYPSVFNGPVGLLGAHPAIPQMGYAGRVFKKNDLLTVDIGFSLEGYHTDKTQVMFAGSRAALSGAARDGHSFCCDVQAWLAEHLKPGAIPSELFAHCMAWVGKTQFAEGFMALGGNKVRFLGHGIGLFIDEYPVIARGFDEPLEQGVVLAIEPKYGISGLGMVGVENTFEVTQGGGRCLTGHEFDMVSLETP